MGEEWYLKSYIKQEYQLHTRKDEQMKYKVIKPTLMDETPLERVLKNRQIADLQLYLQTPEQYSLPYNTLRNIDKVVKRIQEAFENGDVIGLLVDCDVDGYTSASMIYKYITALNGAVQIKLFFHEGKQHGLSWDVIDQIRESGVDLLIIPDAASSDYEELEELDKIMDIIVLDHHETEEESEHAIVVNNQLSPLYKNKQLSGAGVVYRVCQAMDDYFGVNMAEYLLDLCALGNIADGMAMNNLDVRYLVQQGVKNVNNTLMQCIIEKQSKSMNNRVNITTVGWNVAPMLNAVIRIGTQEEKQQLFEGFLSDDEEFCMEVVNMCIKVQRKQSAMVKKLVPVLKDMIEQQQLLKNKVIILDVTGQGDKEIIGLVANKLLSEYERPIMLLHEVTNNNNIISGSVRSPRELTMFKNTCMKTGEFIFCEGHQNAFGCSIQKDKVASATAKLNQALESENLDSEVAHAVDMVIPYGALRKSDVFAIGELGDLWGNGVSEPLFVIKGIKMNADHIKLVGNNNTITFSKSEFSFVKFFTNADTWRDMTMANTGSSKNVVLDVVCKFKINEWGGNVKPQLEIIDFNVTEDDLAFF